MFSNITESGTYTATAADLLKQARWRTLEADAFQTRKPEVAARKRAEATALANRAASMA